MLESLCGDLIHVLRCRSGTYDIFQQAQRDWIAANARTTNTPTSPPPQDHAATDTDNRTSGSQKGTHARESIVESSDGPATDADMVHVLQTTVLQHLAGTDLQGRLVCHKLLHAILSADGNGENGVVLPSCLVLCRDIVGVVLRNVALLCASMAHNVVTLKLCAVDEKSGISVATTATWVLVSLQR